METAITKVEALIEKADSDLNFIANKLETDVTASLKNDGEQVNRMKLITAIQQIKCEHASLVKDVAEIKEKQKEIITEVNKEMAEMVDKLKILQEKPEMVSCSEDS